MTRITPESTVRATVIAVAVLILVILAGNQAAASTSRWSDLNTALTPVNVALQADVATFNQAHGAVTLDVQLLFQTSPFDFDAAAKAAAQLAKDEVALKAANKLIHDTAAQGIRVLDSFPPEQCSAHFTGMEYVYFAAWEDAAVTWLDPSDLSVDAAIWIGGLSTHDLSPLVGGGPIDLEWNRVHCAGKQPAPRTSPSPSPFATQGVPG